KKTKAKVIVNIHDYFWISPVPVVIKDNGEPYKKEVFDYTEWSRAVGGWEEYIQQQESVDLPTFLKEKFKYLKTTLNSVDLAISPSQNLLNDYKKNQINLKNFIVLQNPVYKINSKYQPKDKGELVFGHIGGSGGRGKGVDVAVNAFKTLENVNSRLEIHGNWDKLNINNIFRMLFHHIKAPVVMLTDFY